MGWESSGMVGFDLGPLLQGGVLVLEVLVHCLYGGYNLHRFPDALGLVLTGLDSVYGMHW